MRPCPRGIHPRTYIFQTKSLDPCLDHYLVTPEGRLLLVGSGWQDDDLEHAQNLKGVDVQFHGDMRLLSVKCHREYMARFTHGALEWIKPLAAGEPYDPLALARQKKLEASRSQRSEAPVTGPKPDSPVEPGQS